MPRVYSTQATPAAGSCCRLRTGTRQTRTPRTKLLTKESTILNHGKHTIKIVIQDVGDDDIDSAVFIPTGGFKAFTFVKGDYNLDGSVDSADYVVWSKNRGKTNAKVTDGDGDADTVVDDDDYYVWRTNYGKTGNKDKSADFNRDGVVDNFDYDIWIENYPTLTCAGRFDGDANGDGRVDLDDEAILVDQGGFWRPPPREDWDTTSSASTDDEEIGVTDQITAAVDSTVKAVAAVFIPEDGDADGDGDSLDEDDLKILDELLM